MLFTLEKLVYKVVKQMQTLLSDELTHKLFELYQYEQARGCDSLYPIPCISTSRPTGATSYALYPVSVRAGPRVRLHSIVAECSLCEPHTVNPKP